MNDVIAARNLSFYFTRKQILNRVTLHVQEGEIFGLLGPSGAGKTTLIKVLTGQLRPDGGAAELFGRDTRELRRAERRQIGVMMDSFGLYERLSVYDNLAFYADIYRVSRRVINEILKRIGLYDARSTAAGKLSKGMKSRLSLARALMNNARILFLDEPTAGLDPVTTREIHNILLKQTESEETTSSGIILATANKEKSGIYEVISAGPGTKDVEVTVKPGDKVVVGKFTGTEIKLDGVDYKFVKQEDILAVVTQ